MTLNSYGRITHKHITLYTRKIKYNKETLCSLVASSFIVIHSGRRLVSTIKKVERVKKKKTTKNFTILLPPVTYITRYTTICVCLFFLYLNRSRIARLARIFIYSRKICVNSTRRRSIRRICTLKLYSPPLCRDCAVLAGALCY